MNLHMCNYTYFKNARKTTPPQQKTNQRRTTKNKNKQQNECHDTTHAQRQQLPAGEPGPSSEYTLISQVVHFACVRIQHFVVTMFLFDFCN